MRDAVTLLRLLPGASNIILRFYKGERCRHSSAAIARCKSKARRTTRNVTWCREQLPARNSSTTPTGSSRWECFGMGKMTRIVILHTMCTRYRSRTTSRHNQFGDTFGVNSRKAKSLDICMVCSVYLVTRAQYQPTNLGIDRLFSAKKCK